MSPAPQSQPRNPLHGLTLQTILTALVDHYGWADLAQRISIHCFSSDPSIASSLKFLRKTPWACEKVESLYLFMLRDARRDGAPQAPPMNAAASMKYLAGYPPELLAQVRALMATDRAGESLNRRYPDRHDVLNDGALYDYVARLKSRYMRNALPIAKVVYDSRLHIAQQSLGTHTTVSRIQGNSLKAKREIRIASLFKQAPLAFLRMIVVHELAHLKEREHGKPFYALCTHMEPDYHQLEFDVRLWLTVLEPAASSRDGLDPVGAKPSSTAARCQARFGPATE